MEGRWQNASGRVEMRLCEAERRSARHVPVKVTCLTKKASQRIIYRWEHEDVLEGHRARSKVQTQIN